MRDQKLVVFRAGTAGVGIADQLRDAMVRDGASPNQATVRVWLIDKQGLLTSDMTDLRISSSPMPATPPRSPAGPSMASPSRCWTLSAGVKLTILLGTSTVHGAFALRIVEAMAAATDRPIILAISNPTSQIEAMPADVIAWSQGRALVAAGIPVAPKAVIHARLNWTSLPTSSTMPQCSWPIEVGCVTGLIPDASANAP